MPDRISKFELDRAFNERDVVFLSDQISNEDLSPEARGHLARIIRGLLTGEVSFPNHRPTTKPSSKNTWKIALRALDLRRSGWRKLSAAVKQTSTEFDCSERKVWGCLRQLRKVYRETEVYDWYDSWREEDEKKNGGSEDEKKIGLRKNEKRKNSWKRRGGKSFWKRNDSRKNLLQISPELNCSR